MHPVDLSKPTIALNSLAILNEELDGIEETGEEMESGLKHINEIS